MGVQPPSDDVDDGPDVVEFGIAALDAELESHEVEFPVDADDLAASHGDVSIPVDVGGSDMTLREAVELSDRRQFHSEQDLLNALHPIFEEKREAVSNSLLAQLRALVPF
ncbi:hypothetical protein ACKVMT_03990 [Halobacteriales archaeon Cl-PHB]